MAEEDHVDDDIIDELVELVDEDDHNPDENDAPEPVENAEPTILGMTIAEFNEISRKQWIRSVLLMFFDAGFHPLANSRHLTSLGYEPFPLHRTRRGLFGLSGPEVFCRPNIISYTYLLFRKHGYKVLYIGLDPYVMGLFVERIFTFFAHKYIDFYYPNLGGNPIAGNGENPDLGGNPIAGTGENKEIDLTDMQSFRKRLRYFIRSTTVSTVNIIIVYPFTVMTMRHIAQFIYQQTYGGELKYVHFFGTVMKIGSDEGPKGFYGGLVPTIVGNFLYSAGFATSMFLLSRCITKIKLYFGMSRDSIEAKAVNICGDFVKISAKYMLIQLTMPMKVAAWCMALGGSGIAIPTLPYSDNFESWEEVYGIVKNLPWVPPVRNWFHRTYSGPVRAVTDFDFNVKYYVKNDNFLIDKFVL